MASGKNTKKPFEPFGAPQLPTFGTAPIFNHTLPIVFRLSRPRTWVFPGASFLLGYTITGGGAFYQLLVGLAIACIVTGATNIVNTYADVKEDSINQPSRVLWIGRVGPRTALSSAIILYGLAAAFSVYLGLLYMLVLGLGVFNSLFYSLPPLRFKARPVPSLISFSGAVGLAFLSGLAVNGSLNLLNPVLWLTTYFMFTYGTVKNLPDYAGDKKTGTRTSATIFTSMKSAVLFSGVLLATPYVLLVTLVATGFLSPVYLADAVLIIFLFSIFRKMRRARTSEDLEKAHTLGFFYAISFLLLTLVATSPTLQSLTITVGAFVWTLLVSRIHVDSRVEARDWEKERPRN